MYEGVAYIRMVGQDRMKRATVWSEDHWKDGAPDSTDVFVTIAQLLVRWLADRRVHLSERR